MKNIVANEIKKVLNKKKIKLSLNEIENLIEIPKTIELGDFAFPCFVLSKQLKKNPNIISQDLAKQIKNKKDFSEIKAAGGYLNFFVNKSDFAQNVVKRVLKEKEAYGSSNIGKGKKILIEHTSINPNASPHVGRSRNALIGDTITRILRFVNYKPEVHYYVNDVSKQIAMLVLAKAENKKFDDLLKEYIKISKKVKNSPKLEEKVFEILSKFEKGDKKITSSFKKVVDTAVKGQDKILSSIGIKYDFFDYESRYLKESQKILKDLERTKKLFKDEYGRMVLDLKGTSIEGKMKTPVLVLTRKDGTGLYPLRDIAYTKDKLSKSKENIIILGEDQKLYFHQIKEALKLLKIHSPQVIHYSFILLSETGNSRKMSTRKGDVVLLEDFLKQAIDKAEKEIKKRNTKGSAKKVGIGAVKYAILKNNPNRVINFSLKDALSFEGNTGPYLLYTYARANSILRKSKIKITKINVKNIGKIENELLKKINNFPQIIENSYNNFNPSLITNYSYELSQLFNEFYHACPVIGSENEEFRISLVKCFKQVLSNALGLLGIETLEEM